MTHRAEINFNDFGYVRISKLVKSVIAYNSVLVDRSSTGYSHFCIRETASSEWVKENWKLLKVRVYQPLIVLF